MSTASSVRSSPGKAAVRAHALHRRLGGVTALAGVDLEIPHGAIYGLLGPNGAGKTTLLRILCTLLHPSSGRAWVDGFDVVREADDVRLRIGLALQEAALDPRLTGREFLRLQARLYGLRRAEVTRRLAEVLELVDIGLAIDRRIGTYSGGMRRRVDLAAALIHRPGVLFLDEPTTGLDPATRAAVWEEIRRLNGDIGTTVLLTTQYLEEADRLAHQVGIIDHGRLVAEGAPEALKRSVGQDLIVAELDRVPPGAVRALGDLDGVDHVLGDDHLLAVSTVDGPATIGRVAVALGALGVSPRSLTLRSPTLDDVFLELTGARIKPSPLPHTVPVSSVGSG